MTTNEVKIEQGSEEWLKYRLRRITSTDVPAIVGYYSKDPERKATLCKHKTAYQVWARLTGRYVPPSIESGGARRGHFGEEVACSMFESDQNERIRRPIGVMQHPEHAWLCASPDGIIDRINQGVEVKSPLPETYWEWRDGTPLRHRIQARVAMACGDFDSSLVLVGRDDIEFEVLERKDSFERTLVETCERFLDEYVRPDREPDPYDFDADAPVIDELLRRIDTAAVRLDESAAEDVREFRRLRDLRLRTVKAEKAAKLKVAAFLKRHDADVGVATDGSGVGYKVDARGVRKLVPLVKVKREDIRRIKR